MTNIEIKQEIQMLTKEIDETFERDVHCNGCGKLLFKIKEDGVMELKCNKCGEFTTLDLKGNTNVCD